MNLLGLGELLFCTCESVSSSVICRLARSYALFAFIASAAISSLEAPILTYVSISHRITIIDDSLFVEALKVSVEPVKLFIEAAWSFTFGDGNSW